MLHAIDIATSKALASAGRRAPPARDALGLAPRLECCGVHRIERHDNAAHIIIPRQTKTMTLLGVAFLPRRHPAI